MTLEQMARSMLGVDYAPQPNRAQDGLQTQFFTHPTQAYAQVNGQLADDVYNTACQGLDEAKDWYEYTPIQIRSSHAASSTTGELQPDDWQRIYILQPAGLTYLPLGAYLKYADNWWIVYKSRNMGVGIGQAIVRRCNAVINVLDFYGNTVPIPMSYAKMGTLGNASHATENSITAKNYISCICQLNSYSRHFAENTRLLLGNMAYAMRGLNNFTREFTEDPQSRHLITFTIELTDPLPQDDFENEVADGLAFRWQIIISASGSMNAGSTQQIGLESIRNGETVYASEEHPLSYMFQSSDTNTLTVDENGLVTAINDGEAVITVSLAENPNLKQSVTIKVSSAGSYVEFTNSPIGSLHSLEHATISAVWIKEGTPTDEAISFTFSGADEAAYSVKPLDENSVEITCYSVSDNPLIITASHDSSEAVTVINLLD